MAALLITPAIAARFWTDSLKVMVVLSGLIGGISGTVGTLGSTLGKGLSTGPFIVLTATVIFLFSMLFSPKRGLVSIWFRRFKNDDRLAQKILVRSLYESKQKWIPEAALSEICSITSIRKKRVVAKLIKEEFILIRGEAISLTSIGRRKAEEYILVDGLLELKEMYPAELPFLDVSEMEKQQLYDLSKEQYEELHSKMTQIHKQYPFLNIRFSGRGGQGYEL
jgi:manganese/zinc/iron transport system permease protein